MEIASHLTYSGDLSVATVIVCDMGTSKVGNMSSSSLLSKLLLMLILPDKIENHPTQPANRV